MTADPMINVARVKMRVAVGEHDVSKDKIISRYYKSIDNLKEFYKLCDILHVYDNTNYLEKPVRIVRKHKENTKVYCSEYFNISEIEKMIGKI